MIIARYLHPHPTSRLEGFGLSAFWPDFFSNLKTLAFIFSPQWLLSILSGLSWLFTSLWLRNSCLLISCFHSASVYVEEKNVVSVIMSSNSLFQSLSLSHTHTPHHSYSCSFAPIRDFFFIIYMSAVRWIYLLERKSEERPDMKLSSRW